MREPPGLLVTTPENLTIMLTQDRVWEMFASLAFVIVDEWHELIGNKRSVQTELGLARLRHFAPDWRPGDSRRRSAILSRRSACFWGRSRPPRGALVEGRLDKLLVVDTLLPKLPERFPWAGHLCAKMVDPVVAEIETARTTLVFVNTRSQAELGESRASLTARF